MKLKLPEASCEAKALVRPSAVLGMHLRLDSYFEEELNVKSCQSMVMQFMDSPDLQLYNAGYALRMRKIGEEEIIVTAKRRYPLTAGATPALALEEGLNLAAADGLEGAALDGLKVELELGFQARTLSISGQWTMGPGILPSLDEARPSILERIPEVLPAPLVNGLNKAMPHNFRFFGPAFGLRWKGSLEGVCDRVVLEAWRLPGADGGSEDLVELSFRREEMKSPFERQQRMNAFLGDRLAHGESLKTRLFFERFSSQA